MGQKNTKVQVFRDSPSPSGEGKSCITGPLDSFVTYDVLWDQLVELLKNPMGVAGMQDTSVVQVSETEFTITKTLDMKEFDVKTMHELGLQRLLLDESQLVKWTRQDTRFTEKYKIDKANGRICAERFGTINELVERSWTVLHRDPLRVEFWIEVPGFRRCGPVVMTAARFKLLNPAIRRVFGEDGYMWQMFKGRGEHKDFLRGPCESICQPGQYSVVSDPLDDIADFETLWAATVDVLRYPEPVKEKDWETTEVDQLSDTEFHVRRVFVPDHPKVEEAKPYNTWDRVTLDKANGAIVADTYNTAGALQVKTWYVINRNPVCVECWCEGPPLRKAGSFVKMRLLNVMGIILQRSECAENISRALTDFVDMDTFEDAEEGAKDDLAGHDRDEVEETQAATSTPQVEQFPVDADKRAQVREAWRSRGPEFERAAKEFFDKATAELTERVRQAQEQRQAQERQAQEARQAPEAGQQARPRDEYFECED